MRGNNSESDKCEWVKEFIDSLAVCWDKDTDRHFTQCLPTNQPERGEDMKPREKKPETVFRIISKQTGAPVGSYSRAYCDEYDFESAEQARSANCHGTFKNTDLYKIAKYKVTYELIEDDCDC